MRRRKERRRLKTIRRIRKSRPLFVLVAADGRSPRPRWVNQCPIQIPLLSSNNYTRVRRFKSTYFSLTKSPRLNGYCEEEQGLRLRNLPVFYHDQPELVYCGYYVFFGLAPSFSAQKQGCLNFFSFNFQLSPFWSFGSTNYISVPSVAH